MSDRYDPFATEDVWRLMKHLSGCADEEMAVYQLEMEDDEKGYPELILWAACVAEEARQQDVGLERLLREVTAQYVRAVEVRAAWEQ